MSRPLKYKSKYCDLTEEDHKVLKWLRFVDPVTGIQVNANGSKKEYSKLYEKRLVGLKEKGNYEDYLDDQKKRRRARYLKQKESRLLANQLRVVIIAIFFAIFFALFIVVA